MQKKVVAFVGAGIAIFMVVFGLGYSFGYSQAVKAGLAEKPKTAVVKKADVPVTRPVPPVVPVCKDWNYTVQGGSYENSLWRVSQAQTGLGHLWPVIQEKNKEITAPNYWIHPGQELVIPCSLYDVNLAEKEVLRITPTLAAAEIEAEKSTEILAATLPQAQEEIQELEVPTTKETLPAEAAPSNVETPQPPVNLFQGNLLQVEFARILPAEEVQEEGTEEAEEEATEGVPVDVSVTEMKVSVTVMKKGIYEVRVPQNAVQGLAPGLYATIVVERINKEGYCECKNTVTSVEETEGGFKLAVALDKPLTVADSSSVVFDLGNGVAPVMIRSELLSQGELVPHGRKLGKLGKKSYQTLNLSFPQRRGKVSRILRTTLAYGVPSAIGFVTTGPIGGTYPLIASFVRYKQERAQQKAAALLAATN